MHRSRETGSDRPEPFENQSPKSRHEIIKAVIKEGIMELQQYRFCFAGGDMNFAVFSDNRVAPGM
jgi:hypothetical protein